MTNPTPQKDKETFNDGKSLMVKDLDFQQIDNKMWQLTLGFQPFGQSQMKLKFMRVYRDTKQECIQEMVDGFSSDMLKLKDYV